MTERTYTRFIRPDSSRRIIVTRVLRKPGELTPKMIFKEKTQGVKSFLEILDSYTDGQVKVVDVDWDKLENIRLKVQPNDGPYRGGEYEFKVSSSFPNVSLMIIINQLYIHTYIYIHTYKHIAPDHFTPHHTPIYMSVYVYVCVCVGKGIQEIWHVVLSVMC